MYATAFTGTLCRRYIYSVGCVSVWVVGVELAVGVGGWIVEGYLCLAI
jgi:hypothetical protein